MRIRSFILLIHVAVLYLSWSTAIASEESDILLEIAGNLTVPFSDWNAQNIGNICRWQAVTCINGSVVSLQLNGTDAVRGLTLLRGTLPASIARLRNLKYLDLSENDIIGDFPLEIWESGIESLALANTGLRVVLPSSFPPSLIDLRLEHAHTVGSLPDSPDWSAMHYLELSDSQIRCPLPQSLLEHLQDRRPMNTCRLHGNYLAVDLQSRICGQLPVAMFPCSIYPWVHTPTSFSSDDDKPADVQFSVDFQGHTIEFRNGEAFIFASYRSNNLLRQFRGEFVTIKPFPPSEQINETFFHLNTSRWGSFVQDNPKIVRANLTQVENLVTEYVFEERMDIGGDSYIKFSFNIYNLGHVWRSTTAIRPFRASLAINYHIPHSSANRSTVLCFNRPAVSNCSAQLSTLTTFATFAGTFAAQARTNRSLITYQYGSAVTVDGTLLSTASGNVLYLLSTLPYPLPSVIWLERHEVGGGNQLFDVPPQNQQSYVYLSEFRTLRFSRLLSYDPDLSITLLFDPSRIEESPALAEIAATTFGVGAIVGIVLALVALIIALVFFRFVVFPYLKQRQMPKNAELEEANSKSPDRAALWTKTNPSETPLRNNFK